MTNVKLLLPAQAALHNQYPRLQKFYLFLGISAFASVVYFSSLKPQGSITIDSIPDDGQYSSPIEFKVSTIQ